MAQYTCASATARRGLRKALRFLRTRSSSYELLAPSSAATSKGSWAANFRGLLRKAIITADEVEELKKNFASMSSLASLLLVVLGPLFFPTAFVRICSAFFTVLLFVNASHLFKYIRASSKLIGTVRRYVQDPQPHEKFNKIHAIILPNYCEPLPLLRDTVGRFANHPQAQASYIVVMAMELSEGEDATAKANIIMSEFKSRFLDIVVSFHPKGLAGECAGKGANVAWAAKHLVSAITPRYSPSQIVVTVADADAALSPLYFSEIERELRQPSRPDLVYNPEFRMFSPPIFFARNCQSVPALVRATDAAWSIGMLQNLCSTRGLNIPCSTYSLTLPLALHVGGWDPTRDAIGEDMHMFLKCFYHSKGAARATPIWTPVNLANLQDSDGYVANLKARFTQARRHFAGSADSLYALRHTFFPASQNIPAGLDGPWNNFFDRLLCLLDTLEAHVVPAMTWLSILAMPSLKLLNPTVAASSHYFTVLTALLALPYLGCGIMYEFLHRFLEFSGVLTNASPATTPEKLTFWNVMKSGRTRSFLNLLDYVTLPICALVYVAAPATSHSSAVFRILFRSAPVDFKYVTAAKAIAGLDLASADSQELTQVLSTSSTPMPVSASRMNLVQRPASVPVVLHSLEPLDEAIACEIRPTSTLSLAEQRGLIPKRGHNKHDSTDSGFFDMNPPFVPSVAMDVSA